jgi:cyclophilin family peptidyl-prolyl cis-trans isomerase
MKKIFYSILCLSLLSLNAIAQKVVENKKVKIETTMGTIIVELFADVPQHSANFEKLATEHTLDSLLFHRVIKGFMIQGGDPTSKNAAKGAMLGSGDLGYKVPAEFMTDKHFHKKGALCAARDNNPQMASSASQFYIVQGKVFSADEAKQMAERFKWTADQTAAYTTVGGTPQLDGSYTVFGQVIEGIEVVDAIANVQTGGQDRPAVDVRMLKVSVMKKKRKKFLGIF